MTDTTKALILDERTLEAVESRDMAYLHNLTIVELTEVFGRPGVNGFTLSPVFDTTHRRFVSKWEMTGRRPATEPNTSRDRVPTPPGDQKDPISSTGGDGSPVLTALAEYVDSFTKFPQPEDASPPVASSPPSDLPLTGSEGRAAETTIRCTVCRGRGETLWVEQTWNLMDVPSTELEECDNCVGSGYELIQIDRVAE